MTYRDSNVGSCDHCLDTDAFIVGQDSDGNYCDKCEETLVTDKDLFFGDYRQKVQDAIQGVAISAFLLGVAVGGVVVRQICYGLMKGAL